MTVLNADHIGLAALLERESRTMHPLQFYREAVLNEGEAGATDIVIDGYRSGSFLLARVSGNGSGMTPTKLVSHLATVLRTDKGAKNYGLGARVASLPNNPAGVTFASRTETTTGMMTIIKRDDIYQLKNWPVRDGDNNTTLEEVIYPSHNELERVRETGTAVILHGDGTGSTWDVPLAHSVHNYLSRRFFCFPAGVSVMVEHADGKKLTVSPFGETLIHLGDLVTDGELIFQDVAGLSGTMFWWVLPKSFEVNTRVSGHDRIIAGVGLVVDDEIFDYDQRHAGDFGFPFKPVASRVIVLVRVNGATMDTARTSIVFPTGPDASKRVTPWKALGAYFAEHMPPAIDTMINETVPPASLFTDELARRQDPDWQKWIKPIPIPVPQRGGDPNVGDGSGDALPPGQHHRGGGGGGGGGSPHRAAHRQTGGDDSSVSRPKIVTPRVQFVDPEVMPDGHPHITWIEVRNTIMVSEKLASYVREVQRWVEKTEYPRSSCRPSSSMRTPREPCPSSPATSRN
jgi:hypothetical protein